MTSAGGSGFYLRHYDVETQIQGDAVKLPDEVGWHPMGFQHEFVFDFMEPGILRHEETSALCWCSPLFLQKISRGSTCHSVLSSLVSLSCTRGVISSQQLQEAADARQMGLNMPSAS